MKPMTRIVLATGLLVGAAWLYNPGPARASKEIQKKAKAAGITSVQNCQSCHVDKLPKKEAHKLNERGQWLVDQKEKRKAKEIDVAWLKDCVEKKE